MTTALRGRIRGLEVLAEVIPVSFRNQEGDFPAVGATRCCRPVQAGRNCETQVSSDLPGWVAVSANLALSTSHTVTNLPASSAPGDFYRVREIP